MFWHIIGFAAAFLTTFSFVPQIIKIVRSKSTRDISMVMLIQFCAGLTLWLAYGIHLKNLIIIAANAVSLTNLLIVLSLYFKYRRYEAER